MALPEELCFDVPRLGPCRIPSPMKTGRFVPEDARTLYSTDPQEVQQLLAAGKKLPTMEIAGPRERIFFDPTKLKCGIVTCGGLCPGLNDVIRALVLSLHWHYGVRTIYGFRYGYEGLVPRYGHAPMRLDLDAVHDIHELGGTVLGSSRGPQDPQEMVDYLQQLGVQALFTIGGDGTLRGASAIAEEALRRDYPLSVVGIPKTIDNDISYVQTSFGFETAVSEAWRAVSAAHAEAIGCRNGVGLVRLMGRESGFIAAYVVLADSQTNFCLVPEVPFRLESFLPALEARLQERGHAVIVVAEGAGQDLMQTRHERDSLGQHQAGRHRHLPARSDQGLLCRAGHRDGHEVHRSQLHDSQLAGQPARLGLLPLAGARRGPRRHGRADQPGRWAVEPVLHPRADQAGHLPPQANRPAGLGLEQRAGLHRPAPRLELKVGWVETAG